MVREEELIEDHRSVDKKLKQLLSQIEGGELDPSLFHEIKNGLRNHIFVEEEYSFPAVLKMDSKLSGRLKGLEMEHASLWMLMDRISSEIESEAIVGTPKFVKEIYDILQAHNEQEENNVYPILLKMDPPSGPELLDVKVPEGWICRRLRKNK